MPLHAQTEQIVFGALTCQHDCVERKAFDTRIEPRRLLVVQTIYAHILIVYGYLQRDAIELNIVFIKFM